jgi:predicted alpha/beta hydrolase family esterase
MTFYSGFSLKGEEVLFESFLAKHDFCIAGFSLGAIHAFEAAIASQKRVDTLQLFSPAFFQEEQESFKKLQLKHFAKDRAAYLTHFMANIAYPSAIEMQEYYHDSPIEDLDLLLHYRWDVAKLEALQKKGIMIEVFLGEDDKIINSSKTKAFFQPFAALIMIKNAGHILQRKNDG